MWMGQDWIINNTQTTGLGTFSEGREQNSPSLEETSSGCHRMQQYGASLKPLFLGGAEQIDATPVCSDLGHL